ncbi:XRE family transcriptional regulator [Leifsonia shinshuensis]|uniref:XRE family transcriptional regulator n=1 Tax=Leifsonia shinshuensis TaxID=150026 RepID=A0A7G6Y752_9MICO|nr:XRE family transcriptional regulator [Leifsonia shinshuensis]QNE34317.1 XRE family transcriptional regulator [Leifsonia shinshuensis]
MPDPRSFNDASAAMAVDAIAHLRDVLGPGLVAVIADTTVLEVTTWASGAAAPSPAKRPLLIAAESLVNQLLEVDDAEVVRAWFMGMNPQLDDDSPAEAIADGRIRQATAAAHAFIQGG